MILAVKCNSVENKKNVNISAKTQADIEMNWCRK